MSRHFKDRLASALCDFHIAWRGGRSKPPPDILAARSVLIVKLDALGDFVLLTPFLRELRRGLPQAWITLVTTPAAHALARENPHVNDAHVFPPDRRPRRLGSFLTIQRQAGFCRTILQRRCYDLAIIPRTGPDLHQARLLAYLSGAPERAGFAVSPPAFPAAAEPTRPTAVAVPPLHEAEANLSLLRGLGIRPDSNALELHCRDEERRRLDELIADECLDTTGPVLALGVGAALPHKVWPAECFLRLAGHFTDSKGWSVAIVGDEDDRRGFPASRGRFHNLAGRLSPNQSWAFLQRAALFVGNDSGAMHLAAAAGCPCVVVLHAEPAPADADANAFSRFAPFGVPYTTACPGGRGESGAFRVPFETVLHRAEELATRAAPARGGLRPLPPGNPT